MSTEAWTVYILANGHHGTLYVGATNDLRRRLEEHRAGQGSKFVSKCRVFQLVHVDRFATPLEVIAREKQLKNWHRDWKVEHQRANLDWSNLGASSLGGESGFRPFASDDEGERPRRACSMN